MSYTLYSLWGIPELAKYRVTLKQALFQSFYLLAVRRWLLFLWLIFYCQISKSRPYYTFSPLDVKGDLNSIFYTLKRRVRNYQKPGLLKADPLSIFRCKKVNYNLLRTLLADKKNWKELKVFGNTWNKTNKMCQKRRKIVEPVLSNSIFVLIWTTIHVNYIKLN